MTGSKRKEFCKNGHDVRVLGRYKSGNCVACAKIESRRHKIHLLPHRGERMLSPHDYEYGPGFTSERLGDYYVIEEDEHMLDLPTLPIGGHSVFGSGWPDSEGMMILTHRLTQPQEVYLDRAGRMIVYSELGTRQKGMA